MDSKSPSEDTNSKPITSIVLASKGNMRDDLVEATLIAHSADRTFWYGWLNFRPAFLQRFNRPFVFTIVASITLFLQGALCTGFGNSALTTIERRYGLKTTQVALFGTFFHISAGLAGPFVGYFGRRHRPRFMALGCMSLLAGAVVVSIPYFLSDSYQAGVEVSKDLCIRLNASLSEEASSSDCVPVEGGAGMYVAIIICGYCLLGLGTVPLYSMAASHIDDVCKRGQQAVFLSTIVLASLMGPALGYILGKPILNVYIDVRQPESSFLKPGDKNWLGAWWLGYLAIGFLIFAPVVPLLGFAAEFPDTQQVRDSRRKLEDSIQENKTLKHDLASFFPATKELVRNGPFVAICMSYGAECLMLGGFAIFLPKFIENQFQFTSSSAALYTGFLLVPGALVGISSGAYLSRRFHWDCKNSLRFSSVMAVVATVAMTCALIGCDSVNVVGYDVPYENSTGPFLLDDRCRGGCHCRTTYYKPICTPSNQLTYFSPCHAGCSPENKNNLSYCNCSCFRHGVSEATEGRCRRECWMFPLFSAMAFLMMAFTFINNVPLLNAVLRVVPEGQGSFAMGFQQVFVRFLGFIPAPTVYGRFIDRSCKIWSQDECTGETRSCLEYENSHFRQYMFMLGGSCKVAGFLLLLLAYKLYRPPRSSERKSKDFIDLKETTL